MSISVSSSSLRALFEYAYHLRRLEKLLDQVQQREETRSAVQRSRARSEDISVMS